MKTRSAISPSSAGFTMLEIMVVILIIGLLATVVVPNIGRMLFKGNEAKVLADITNLENAVQMYKAEKGRWPQTLDDLAEVDETGFSFIQGDSLPFDPWEQDYFYEVADAGGKLLIGTYGADMSPGGEGENADITNQSMRERN